MICEMKTDSLATLKIVEGFDYSRIMSINQTPDSSAFLIGTDGNGLFRLHLATNNNILSRFTGFPDLETLTIKSVTEDRQHNFWLSTSGTGAVKLQFTGKSDTLGLR
jgi:ligand-binding sensor domain-containing protein